MAAIHSAALAAVLMIGSAAAGAVRDYAAPTFLASFGSAPTVDGRIDEKEWQDASSFGGFLHNCVLGEDMRDFPLLYVVPTDTTVWAKWDETNLYLAFRCKRLRGVPLVHYGKPDQRDTNLCRGDAIEIFIMPNAKKNFFFVGDPGGAIFDGTNRPDDIAKWIGSWDGRWTYQTNVTDDAWEGELAIPFEDLGGPPAEGGRWGFTVGRYQPGFTRSALSPIGGVFFAPKTYGSLVFSRRMRVAASWPQVALRTVLKLEVTNLGRSPSRAGSFRSRPAARRGSSSPTSKAPTPMRTRRDPTTPRRASRWPSRANSGRARRNPGSKCCPPRTTPDSWPKPPSRAERRRSSIRRWACGIRKRRASSSRRRTIS